MGSDLTAIAAELYGLTPAAFTAARNARAKAAARDSRELAQRVRALPKPSAAAWAVNALVRAQPGVVEDLRALRERFAEAQHTGDRAELRALDAQRHDLIGTALAHVLALGAEAGVRLSAQAAQHVEQTLRAAVADENAAAAVQSGVLVRTVTASGFEPVDVTDAVAVPLTDVPQSARLPASRVARPGGERGRRRARRAAEHALAEAEQCGAAADADVRAAEQRLRRVHGRLQELRDEEEQLRERLTALTAEVTGLQRERRSAEAEREKAGRSAARAADACDRARARVAAAEAEQADQEQADQ